ncbi:MAG: DNA repair protein [Pelagimonas sp.]|jgi:hypothetical protein|nr:DNA repair protein [Pelagimonas sp.]
MTHLKDTTTLVQLIAGRVSFALVLTLGAGLGLYTLACVAGLAPWLSLTMISNDTVFDAGKPVQLGVLGLSLILACGLPSQARLMALETSHRRFQVGMDDVTRAYALAHAADRADTFALKGEFDAIRERILFMRDHPDLSDLQPEVLELAAQMSHVSSELAETYSDTKVSEARAFIKARKTEVERLGARIQEVKTILSEIRHWNSQVDMEEALVRSKLDSLQDELETLLPSLSPAQAPAQPLIQNIAKPAPDAPAAPGAPTAMPEIDYTPQDARPQFHGDIYDANQLARIE